MSEKNLTVEEVEKIFESNKELIFYYETIATQERLSESDEEVIEECRQTMRLCVEFVKRRYAVLIEVSKEHAGYADEDKWYAERDEWHSLLTRLTKEEWERESS